MVSKFATIAISGGGSKGPYACGVLQGIEKFAKERLPDLNFFYSGTSVGALNAALAAQGELQKLSNLYGQLTTKQILGEVDPKVSGWRLWRNSDKNPFYYFENSSLKKIISENANFEKLKDSHLAICASNYLTGNLETFYVSSLIDQFLKFEEGLPAKSRRLNHYHKISSQGELVDALLASASIPFFFSPVRIAGNLYVDGGVGNNTPLRQVAYFSRLLSKLELGETTLPICIVNDPDRFTIDDDKKSTSIFSIINRSIDIFQNELVSDSMTAWHRINKEVEHNEKQLADLIEFADAMNVPVDEKNQLKTKLHEILGKTTAATNRKNIPMNFVMPSTPLVDDVLKFDPDQSRLLRRRGVADCLAALAHGGQIDNMDQALWVEQIA